METLSRLAKLVRKARPDAGQGIPLGQVQELLAAVFGHNNLASYQASDDDANILDAPHIVFDQKRLALREAQLDQKLEVADVSSALDRLGAVGRYFDDEEGLLVVLQQEFDAGLIMDSRIGSEIAMTNGDGPDADIELPFWNTMEEFDGVDDLVASTEGIVSVDQDPDKVYYGHEVEVEVDLRIPRLGRRLFGELQFKVTSADLRWGGEKSDALTMPARTSGCR